MENFSQTLISVLEYSSIFLFGSYLEMSDYNDIDCLIVTSKENITNTEWQSEIKKVKDLHLTIYSYEEFENSENKFSRFGKKKIQHIELNSLLDIIEKNNIKKEIKIKFIRPVIDKTKTL